MTWNGWSSETKPNVERGSSSVPETPGRFETPFTAFASGPARDWRQGLEGIPSMNRGPTDVLDDVRVAISAQGKAPLSDLALEFCLTIDLCAPFPDDLFAQYMSLLADPLFRGHEDAWNFVRQAEDSWELLSASQREQLRPLLIESFDKWAHWMGAFVIGELLGRRYGDQAALETLGKLARGATMPARGLVPHGLETLARQTADVELRQGAVHVLHELEKDADELVREEAVLSLGKIARSAGAEP